MAICKYMIPHCDLIVKNMKFNVLPSSKTYTRLVFLPLFSLIFLYIGFFAAAYTNTFRGTSEYTNILLGIFSVYFIFSLILIPVYLFIVSGIFFFRKERRIFSVCVFLSNLFWLLLMVLGMSMGRSI